MLDNTCETTATNMGQKREHGAELDPETDDPSKTEVRPHPVLRSHPSPSSLPRQTDTPDG